MQRTPTARRTTKAPDRTTMDEIAAAAGVSKQTLYKQFSDRAQLFLDVVRALVTAASDPVQGAVRVLEMTGELECDLVALTRRQLELVLRPRACRRRTPPHRGRPRRRVSAELADHGRAAQPRNGVHRAGGMGPRCGQRRRRAGWRASLSARQAGRVISGGMSACS